MQLRGMYCVMTVNISIISLSLVNSFYHVNHKSYQGDTVIKKFDTEKDSIHRDSGSELRHYIKLIQMVMYMQRDKNFSHLKTVKTFCTLSRF